MSVATGIYAAERRGAPAEGECKNSVNYEEIIL